MINNNSEKKEYKKRNNKKKSFKRYASLKKDGIDKFLKDRKIRSKEIDRQSIVYKYEKDLIENKGFYQLKTELETKSKKFYINEEELRLKVVEYLKIKSSVNEEDLLKINITTYFFRNENEMKEFIKETSKEK